MPDQTASPKICAASLRLFLAVLGDLGEQFGQLHAARWLRPRSATTSVRRMRKEDGTMPLAAPECTPSVRTRTVRLPIRLPRKDVVSQS